MWIFDRFKKLGNTDTDMIASIKDALPAALSKRAQLVRVISDTAELKDVCLASRNAIINAENGETAISYALSAQLKVIDVLQSPEIAVSPFELMIEALDRAVSHARNEEERSDLQLKAAVMTNNMVFFMEAKLYYEKDVFKKEGEQLLIKACDMLAETATGLLASASGVGVKIIGETLYKGIRDGFFTRIAKLWGAKERTEKYQKEFTTFLTAAFDRLRRNHDVFGKSRILTELILRYKDRLSEGSVGDKRRDLKEFIPDNPVLKKCRIQSLVYLIVNGVVFMSQLFFLFNWWGGDAWLETIEDNAVFYPLFSIHFSILGIPFLLKLLLVILAVGYYGVYVAFLMARDKTIAGEYYRCIANLFN
jgi:hypothetical protein